VLWYDVSTGHRYRLLFHISTCEWSLSNLLTCSRINPGFGPTGIGLERKAQFDRADGLRASISNPSIVQSSSYLTGILLAIELVTSLLLDLCPMRHTHTYDYSGLRIDGQMSNTRSNLRCR
jgi:hypothetical protein